jgi:hypothetical protein
VQLADLALRNRSTEVFQLLRQQAKKLLAVDAIGKTGIVVRQRNLPCATLARVDDLDGAMESLQVDGCSQACRTGADDKAIKHGLNPGE